MKFIIDTVEKTVTVEEASPVATKETLAQLLLNEVTRHLVFSGPITIVREDHDSIPLEAAYVLKYILGVTMLGEPITRNGLIFHEGEDLGEGFKIGFDWLYSRFYITKAQDLTCLSTQCVVNQNGLDFLGYEGDDYSSPMAPRMDAAYASPSGWREVCMSEDTSSKKNEHEDGDECESGTKGARGNQLTLPGL